MKFTLPWPPKELSPNKKHAHWAQLHRARKKYKEDCGWAILENTDSGMLTIIAKRDRELDLVVTFHPPDRRRHDRDNLIGRFKPGQDALALAALLDDSKFTVTYRPIGEPVKGGQVVVEVLG